VGASTAARGEKEERKKEERETHHPDGTPTSARLVPQLPTHADHIPVRHLPPTPMLPTRALSVTPPPARARPTRRRHRGRRPTSVALDL